MEQEWKEDLCDCCSDFPVCCYGWCCTACLFGSNAEQISGKNCCLMCCAYQILALCALYWVPHYYERQKLREKYNLKPNPSCGDCLTACCCSPCAICQEARELKARDSEKQALNQNSTDSKPILSQPLSSEKKDDQSAGTKI
ncbi:unnamed protein product [Rotaria magnacalcarata]|uniref:Uncharacterized protein n=1 Tax=Rotaria magnacalcarata TaxID=392030 RepID=A0A816RSF8_9BILA|nr:unnamed protein product [Rotaria magnacalcarata]CAF3919133.1 unnamed protein product [Rotaria magnacalcarata]